MPIYQQTEGGPWWVTISVPGKPRIRESLRTKDRREAETRARKLERAAWEGSLIEAEPASTAKTLDDVFCEVLENRWEDT
ncbi:hypothetical protein [Aquabacterium sp.]|uniref:hypothetical protein n=1 Tax=Aquabacterium sp. TaxID=1872578 RepID=UPI004037FF5C